MSEVERGLFFANTLWTVVPQIVASVREALAIHYPGDHFDIQSPFRFGTWIGGDRDAHPFVTPEVTAASLKIMRDTAVEAHLAQCRSLMSILVMSDRLLSTLMHWCKLSRQQFRRIRILRDCCRLFPNPKCLVDD